MPKPDLPLNPVVRDMGEASSIYVNQLVYDLKRAGEDVTTLSLGEAYFDIPLFNFNSLNVPGSYHYSESQGLRLNCECGSPATMQSVTKYAGHDGRRSQILISAGSKAIIYLAMLAVIAPGDEVLIHEPAWLSYPEQVRLIGGQPCFIPFYCPVTEFAKHFTSRTRVLILCNPNNPTGRVYSERELARVYEDCRSCGIYLLVDEAYSEFVLDGTFRSIARIVPDLDGIIVVNSISKNLGISGWRIGYAIANHEFIGHMLKLNQHIITCAPTILLMCSQLVTSDGGCLPRHAPQVRYSRSSRKRQRIAKDAPKLATKVHRRNSDVLFFRVHWRFSRFVGRLRNEASRRQQDRAGTWFRLWTEHQPLLCDYRLEQNQTNG